MKKMPEMKVVTALSHIPNIQDIDVYMQNGGYDGLKKALTELKPEEITEMVIKANLRGRGGAGFPAGRKWSFLPKDPTIPKYLVCNADEGEPGTFNNRELMEDNPHQLIEGCLICAYAIGAEYAFILIRGEYYHPAEVLEQAIQQCYEKGIAGPNVLGSGRRIEMRLHRGAGSYEVGEETALIECLEGNRGNPRQRPPFPAISGAYNKPTVVNNVETLCNVSHIVRNGPEWFLGIGAPKCPGTKLFSISGNVANPGNYEAPMGTPFRELIEMAGGVPNGRTAKIIMLGAAPPFLSAAHHMDLAADIDSVTAAGSALGSGSIIIADDSNCAVRLALRAEEFFHHESCGKCTPCREGTGWMTKILSRIEAGNGREADLDLLADICFNISGRSLCALGDFATGPITSTLKYFRDEYETHVRGHVCRPQLVGASAP